MMALLKIRYLQFYRGFKDTGFVAPFLVGFVGLVGFIMFAQLGNPPINYLIVGAFLISMLSIQISRKDKRFLQHISDNPSQIFFVEYFLLCLPLSLALLYYKDWWLVLALLGGLSGIAHIQYTPQISTANHWLQGLIPAEAVEWKAGVRKFIYVLLPTWLIGFFGAFWIGSVPIALFILGLVPIGFYYKGEPVEFLLAQEKNPQAFLFHKIKNALYIFSILFLPLMSVFILFHTHLWYISVIEYILFGIFLCYSILVKYTFYEPNTELNAASFFSTLGIVSCLIPFLIFIPIILSIRFYFKALQNLNFYLDDFH